MKLTLNSGAEVELELTESNMGVGLCVTLEDGSGLRLMHFDPDGEVYVDRYGGSELKLLKDAGFKTVRSDSTVHHISVR